VAVGACLLFLVRNLPPVAFGDELTILLPGLSAVTALARMLSWPGIFAMAILCCAALIIAVRHERFFFTAVLAVGFLATGILVALFGRENGLALRYPPFMNLLQAVAAVLTHGSLSFFRLPNVLWTVGFGWTLWQFLPRWSETAKWTSFFVVSLGPLGWTYRTVLYQACGELTLGLITSLLLAHVLNDTQKRKSAAALLGAAFAFWILYRTTAIAALFCSLILLWLLRHRVAAKIAAAVALPVAFAWLALAPLYTAQYGFGSAQFSLFVSVQRMVGGLVSALFALPLNFHPLGLAALIGGTFLAWYVTTQENRRILLASWCIGISTAIFQQLLAGPVFFGVARYNILLLLPLTLSIGMLIAEKKFWIRGMGVTAITVIVWVTPFSFISFAQEIRHTVPHLYQTPTEGYLPLPTLEALTLLTAKHKNFAFLGPNRALLDLLVVQGKLTKEERTVILERSDAWNLSSPQVPVLIQAPVQVHYQPNLSPNEESLLRETRNWGLTRPHTLTRLGTEETLIVWE
jgi:hypothetical protein